ncbi:MAG TPA: hypothetical protein VFS62_08820 [Chloroflexota bacterium]|jgi:hypothetical protein|nr:hypothetical protein [Chloroflexota bacterium]
MAGAYQLKTIPQCICGHSQDGHDVGVRPGCGFCRCPEFVMASVIQEQVWALKPKPADRKTEPTFLRPSLTGSVFGRLRSRVGSSTHRLTNH